MPDSHWSADRFHSIYSQKMLYELARYWCILRVRDESRWLNKRARKERWDQAERNI
nr:hypothetical protein [Escherichia coli O25b:H4-ST131]